MREYTLNPDAARAGDSSGGRIDVSGGYAGVCTRAEAVTAPKGTEGIELAFTSDSNESADFLSLWTHNKDGEEIFGFKILQAIMTCMKLRGIKPQQGMVEKWDNGSKCKMQATIYPELMGPRIGLILQREEYAKNDGAIGTKMNVVGAFDAETRLTASEILDRKAQPERLDKMLAALKDKHLPASKQQASNNQPPQDMGGFDDDIPF